MTNEQAKSELMQIYMSLSEEKKQALDVLMAQSVTQKPETVTEFADRCRECGREKVLDKIRAEIKDIAFDSQEIDGEHESFMIVYLDDALNIIDKYKGEQK